MLEVTPTLVARAMPEAMAFYEAAGFEVEPYDEGFAFVRYADASVFDLVLHAATTPEDNAGGCYIVTDDVDTWHARLSAAGLPVTEIATMPWGMREFALTDPSGNRLRFGRSS